MEAIRNYLRVEFEMDDEDIQEMVEIFIESMTELSEKAKTQVQASDSAGLGETGHAVKGAAANVGAEAISKLGREMETAGKAGDIAKCAECAAEFAKLVSELQ